MNSAQDWNALQSEDVSLRRAGIEWMQRVEKLKEERDTLQHQLSESQQREVKYREALQSCEVLDGTRVFDMSLVQAALSQPSSATTKP